MSPRDDQATGLEIAVIGMACRFPGAPSVEAFWENLRAGVESVSFFGDEELLEAGVPRAMVEHPDYVKAAAILGDVTRFDAGLFGYTPRDAQTIDPQQRLFLEVSWEALERAGHEPQGGATVGVYAGCNVSTYFLRLAAHPGLRQLVSPFEMVLGTDKDFLSSRVAYKLDLDGPAVGVQTACSTSLVAVHLACQGLLAGECDVALAGGAGIRVPEKVGHLYQTDGIHSRDGHNRAFDAAATGTVGGNGVGAVVLKRLADAVQDGDRISAVIRGSAMNNDGAQRVGFTAPGVEGQAKVVQSALALAGVEPDDLGYVEAHGTATALGDPIEVAALSRAFRARTARRGFCGLGSVKTNIGHLDAAAGLAGLIKTVLMLEHRELVPSLHFESPNPKINFEESPFHVVTRREPWSTNGRPRRAGVSSFGMGGTNVHVVLEETPAVPAPPPSSGPYLLALSARTTTALERATDRLAEHLAGPRPDDLADVALTLRRGRRALPARRAVVCGDAGEGARRLAAREPQRVRTGVADERGRPVAFLFPGQGAQHVHMAGRIYSSEPVFRREVDVCAEVLKPRLGIDLRDVLYPRAAPATPDTLAETRLTQPALFVVEYALARLWMSWGVTPDAMIGHSIGEYVAACLAGVMGREAALGLVAERARLMQSCPLGAMLAVPLGAATLRPLIDRTLSLAADNGPDACVVSGATDDVERLEARLDAEGHPHARLQTSHAFHSELMEPAVEPFRDALAGAELAPPKVPFVSNLTGTWITPAQATDPTYWVRHLRETVRFGEGLAALLEDPRRVLLEVGPGHTMVSLARRRFGADDGRLALPSLPHPRQKEPDDTVLLDTAARLWVAGIPVDWTSGDGEVRRRRVLLPTYPFEGDRYWIESPRHPVIPSAEKRPDPDHWLYVPSWRRTTPPARRSVAGVGFCLFVDASPLCEALAGRLRDEGAEVTVVRPGPAFARTGPGDIALDPASPTDHESLVRALAEENAIPERFVHLWGAAPAAVCEGDREVRDRSFFSVLALGQALGRRDRQTLLVVVARGVQEVTGEEALDPERSLALGPSLVLPQEYPHVACRHVDVDGRAEGAAAELADALRVEVAADPPERVLAYRGRHRWARAFEPVAVPPGSTPRLRPAGTYLITGGLGTVGLALAESLARSVRARLVLTGREGLPSRDEWEVREKGADATAARIRAVRDLERLGSEVEVLAADASDVEAMRATVAQARSRFGALDGVIHAAGAIDAGTLRPLPETGRGDCERQFRPKVAGTEVLAEVLGEARLDFVLLTSSLSTALGGLGFAAYSAANHFQDAFVRRQHLRGHSEWLSVGWDAWGPRGASRPTAEAGPPVLSAAEGGEIFLRVLRLDQPAQVFVSTADLEARLAQWSRPSDPVSDPAAADAPRHARPELHTEYVAPETPTERRLAEIWAGLLGLERVGVHDNFFELGGSSLLAVRLVGTLKQEFGGELSVATIFEAPTVRALGRIVGKREASRGREAAGVSPSGHEPRQTSDRQRGRTRASVERSE